MTAMALLNVYGAQAPQAASKLAAEMRSAGCKKGEREWIAVCDAVLELAQPADLELARSAEGQLLH